MAEINAAVGIFAEKMVNERGENKNKSRKGECKKTTNC
jgi:hypothetical protein